MLEDIVPVPFQHCPIELLSPAPRDRQSAFTGSAQRGHRRGFLEVTLQVPVGSKLAKLFCHQSRISTVRSLPGILCPTDTTESVTFSPDINGGSVRPPTLLETIVPAANVSVQYAVPLTFTWAWTGASAAPPNTANTSLTACDASTTIASPTEESTARNPST